jgi:hypothetical protein
MHKSLYALVIVFLGLIICPNISSADWQTYNHNPAFWQSDHVEPHYSANACEVSFYEVPAELQDVRVQGIAVMYGMPAFRGSIGTNGSTYRNSVNLAAGSHYQFEVDFAPSGQDKNIFFVMDDRTNPSDWQTICDGLVSSITLEWVHAVQ